MAVCQASCRMSIWGVGVGGVRAFPICSPTWEALISQFLEVCSPEGIGPHLTLIIEITVLLALLS